MRRTLLLITLCILFLYPSLSAQKAIQVNCRIVENGNFVNTLGIDDFQVLINGQPQTIEALYLVEGNQVVKKTENVKNKPKLNREYSLVFNIRHYEPRIDQVINFFFQRLIQPGDSLKVYTPIKFYNLRPQAIQGKPKADLVKQLVGLIRRDTQQGSDKYLSQMKSMTKTLQGSTRQVGQAASDTALEMSLMRYGDMLSSLEGIRVDEQKRLLSFIESQKKGRNPKYIYVFYEKEVKPDFTTQQLQQFQTGLQDKTDTLQKLNQYFEYYNRDILFDIKKLKQAFSASSMQVNLLIYRNRHDVPQGVNLREYSSDFFEIFNSITDATGGIVDSSSNPAEAFLRAAQFSHMYYAISFKPLQPLTEAFNEIEIRVKNPDLKVLHPLGVSK